MPPLPPADANSATRISNNSIADTVTDNRTQESASARVVERPRGNAAQRQTRTGVNWFRFWIQMLVAMMVFNIIAGLVTWYFIFPHLHPPR